MNLLTGARLPAVLAVMIFSLPKPAVSQVSPSDTTRSDTTRSMREDSLPKYAIPIELVGSIERSIAPPRVIDDSTMHFMDYESLADLVGVTGGAFIFGLGSPGQFQGLTLQGLGARDISLLGGGTLLNNSSSGTYDLNLSSLEDIGRIEIVSGTRSFLYGLNSTGGTINLVNKNRKALHPYSHVRYSEGGYGYSMLDGIVSQNISRGFNITAGILHRTVDGRFANTDGDAWSGRARLRYNLSGEINLFGSEVYNQTRLDMNGGIDSATQAADRFDRIRAKVQNADSYEKVFRHDMQLGIATNFRADSNAINTLTFYYSTNLREYRDEGNRPTSDTTFFQQNQYSRWYGLKLAEHRLVNDVALDIGAEIQHRRFLIGPPGEDGSTTLGSEVGSTDYSAFAKSEMHFSGILQASAYGRFESYFDQHEFSFGADAAFNLSGPLELFAGASRSSRFPTPQELYGTPPVISSTISAESERHLLVEGGLRSLPGGACSFELTAFQRSVEDPVVLRNSTAPQGAEPFEFDRGETQHLRGIDGAASFRIGSFLLEGSAQYLEVLAGSNVENEFPKWTGRGGAWFRDSVFGSHLDLKAGFQGRFFSSFQGRGFDQLAQIDVPTSNPETIDVNGTVDFLLIAHIGSAYVHLVWENLFDRQYIMRIFYPMPERNIRFGISWDFLD
ncbi:MAG: hypothetical protein AUI33_18145 [Ignavibacteria bacterium 13_1_40CM_2_61_4]|nr:MAG: hypothetical protein AUI33_18145 [Ignavibacteria bacterium 13_1_40CM_2_61_4]